MTCHCEKRTKSIYPHQTRVLLWVRFYQHFPLLCFVIIRTRYSIYPSYNSALVSTTVVSKLKKKLNQTFNSTVRDKCSSQIQISNKQRRLSFNSTVHYPTIFPLEITLFSPPPTPTLTKPHQFSKEKECERLDWKSAVKSAVLRCMNIGREEDRDGYER